MRETAFVVESFAEGTFAQFVDDRRRDAPGEIDAAMRLHHHCCIAGETGEPDDEVMQRLDGVGVAFLERRLKDATRDHGERYGQEKKK